jgi:hypothetical protein
MAVARVVSFEGVPQGRMQEMKSRIESEDPPEGLNPSEMFLLHDSGNDKAMAIVLFDSEEDYQRGNEVLNAMPADDVPGQRTGVEKYDVAIHMKR